MGHQAGQSATVHGSVVQADDTLAVSGNQVNLLASDEQNSNSNGSESAHVGASVTLFEANSGINLDASYSRNETVSNSQTHTNRNVKMMNDQEVYQHIGKALWSIMPESASVIYCVGMVYPDTYQIGPEWMDKNGVIQYFDNYPNEFCDNIYCLTQKLQRLSPFDRDPWTHFKATLTEAGKFKMDFAYIPEDDSWPGLFMKRVSELSFEEAEEKYIPEEEWKKCVDKYGS